MNPVLSFTVQLARQSGEILLDYFHRSHLKTDYKPDHSIVTEADIAADRHISLAIRSQFPGDILLSEELQPSYAQTASNPPVWIIDPIDGTTNFSLGLHYWGISIVRVENGFPSLAVQYFPFLNELFTALKGGGAFRNEQPIHVWSPNPADKTTFFSCCSRTFKNYQVSIPYKTRIFGSATYSMCNLACGKALISFEAKAKIWDYAGAWLMIPEAGGCIEIFDHSEPFPLDSKQEFATHNDAIIAAATPELLEKARKKIVPKQS